MGKIKIAIVGYGVMGQVVEQELNAKSNLFQLQTTIDPQQSNAAHKHIDQQTLAESEVAICFSQPQSMLDTVKKLAENNVKLVVATTGWEKDHNEAKQIISASNGALIYSSNFSIGVLIYFELLKEAAKKFQQFDEYKAYGYEIHHQRKLDSPSGTLKKCAEIITSNMPRQNKIINTPQDRELDSDEIFFGAIRGGDVAGVHNVNFDSTFDSIEIKHQAKNRRGFAIGALKAAQWIVDKQGWHDERSLIKDIFDNN